MLLQNLTDKHLGKPIFMNVFVLFQDAYTSWQTCGEKTALSLKCVSKGDVWFLLQLRIFFFKGELCVEERKKSA